MKKRVLGLVLIGLMTAALSACGGQDQKAWEMYIGRWEIVSYEMSEGVFTEADPEWCISGEIVFLNKEDISVNISAERGSDAADANFINDKVQLDSDWKLLNSGDIEVYLDGQSAAVIKYKDDTMTLTTQNGTFTLRKISDDPSGN